MERVNRRWADRVDYPEGHDQDYGQEGEEQDLSLWRYEISDPDYDDSDYDEVDYDEAVQEEVEHLTGDDTDDVGHSDFHAQFGWRSKMRRGRGRFVPPDTRGLVAPVFVRRADPGAKTSTGSGEERAPTP